MTTTACSNVRLPSKFWYLHDFNKNEKDFMYYLQNRAIRNLYETRKAKKIGFILSTVKSYFTIVYKWNSDALNKGETMKKIPPKRETDCNRDFSAVSHYNNFLKDRKENSDFYKKETSDKILKEVIKIIEEEKEKRGKNKKILKNPVKKDKKIKKVSFEKPKLPNRRKKTNKYGEKLKKENEMKYNDKINLKLLFKTYDNNKYTMIFKDNIFVDYTLGSNAKINAIDYFKNRDEIKTKMIEQLFKKENIQKINYLKISSNEKRQLYGDLKHLKDEKYNMLK